MKRLKLQKTMSGLPHPKDRKVDQFQRKLRRDVRIDQQKEQLSNKQSLTASRFFWFREQCCHLLQQDPKRLQTGFTAAEIEALCQLYVDRNDVEVAELKKLRNVPQGRVKHLSALKQLETDQFLSVKGLSVPSLTTTEAVEILCKIWDGDAKMITCVPVASCRKANLAPKELVSSLLATTLSPDSVRESNVAKNSSSKLRRFMSEGKEMKNQNVKHRAEERKRSVKTVKSASDVAREGKQRRVLQQQVQTKARRQAAIAVSRGLMQ